MKTDNKLVRKDVDIEAVETVGDRTLRFTISSETVDRDYDRISLSGWQLDNYRKNPIVIWGHDLSTYPVGRVTEVNVIGNALKATVEFVPADVPIVGEQAEAVFQLLKQGFLSATSVGFSALEFELSDRLSPTGKPGLNILKAELCELSIVTLPSNPDALLEARSFRPEAKPIEKAAEVEVEADLSEDKQKHIATLRQRHQRRARLFTHRR